MHLPLFALEALFVFLWSSGFIAVKYTLEAAGVLDVMAMRYGLLLVLLTAWLALTGRLRWPGRKATGQEAVVGLLAHFATIGAGMVAMNRGISPGLVALLAALYPMLTAVLSGPVLGERVPRRHWAGIGIALIGVLLIIGPQLRLSADPAAFALAAVPPLALTAASLFERRAAKAGTAAELPVLGSLLVQSGATTLAALAIAPVFKPSLTLSLDPNLTFILALSWLILGVSLGSYALYWHLLRHFPAERVVSLTYYSAPLTMILGWLAFGDALDVLDGLGFAVAAVGVWLTQRGSKSARQ